jgi:hypothetical protein
VPATQTTLDVRASWDGVIVGGFTFGNSTFGGTDKFTPVYGAVFGGTYDNLSSLVTQASWQRGRNDLASGILAGTGTVTINDPTGIYNPANPNSPLVGKLKPMRPFYIKATDSLGVSQGCFRGFLQDSPTHDASTIPARTTFTLVDLFAVLAGIFPTIAATGTTTTGAAIGLVLDQAQFTEPSLRILATGDSIATFSADASKSALTLIGDLLTAEQGQVFVNGSGAFVYLDRNDRYRRLSAATISGTVRRLTTGSPVNNIINRQVVTAGAGVPQANTDVASAGEYNYRDGGAISTPYLANDQAAADAAQRIVNKKSTPRTLLSQFDLSSQVAGNLDQIVQREFGDFVTIPAGGAGITGSQGDYFIEQIAVQASKGGVLDCSWILSARTTTDHGFIFGTSVFADVPVGGNMSVTASGNEITDAVRAAALNGDGRSADSSFGIYEQRANLCTNGGFEVDLSGGWITQQAATLTRDTSQSKFGAACAKLQCTGTTFGLAQPGVSVTNGVTYTFSVWVNRTETVDNWGLDFQGVLTGSVAIPKVLGWQRVSLTATATASGNPACRIINNQAGAASAIYIDGVMFNAGPVALPYCEGTIPACRVQVPVTGSNGAMLSESQGGVIVWLGMDWPSTTLPNGAPIAVEWANFGTPGAENQFSLYRVSSAQWGVDTRRNGGLTQVRTATTHVLDDPACLLMAWTDTAVKIGANGGAQASAARNGTIGGAALPATFEIGNRSDLTLPIDSRTKCAVTFTGTITDADWAAVYALGPDKSLAEYNAAAANAHFSAVWNAATTTVDNGGIADPFAL